MRRDVLRSFTIVFFSICFLCIICKCTWAGPNVKFDQTSFDFGKVVQGKSVTYIFKFENIGNDPLKINKVRAGWGCTAVNLSARDIEAKNSGEIKATLHTSGRMGKQKKVISVETNDPNQAVIKLTLLATVEVEILFDPTTVYFRDMNQGDERNQRVHLKNTSGKILQISAINPGDEMVKVDLINRTPDWPLELKQDESLDLLVSFLFQLDKPRYSKQIKINYKGGEGNVAQLRVYATKKPKPKKPQEQTKPLPENVNQQKDTKQLSVETSPSKEVFPMPPPPPDMPPKEEKNEPKEKAPE